MGKTKSSQFNRRVSIIITTALKNRKNDYTEANAVSTHVMGSRTKTLYPMVQRPMIINSFTLHED